MLESVYEVVMARDLSRRGFRVERQKTVAFDYDAMYFEELRIDLLVNGCVVNNLSSPAFPREPSKNESETRAEHIDPALKLAVGFAINGGVLEGIFLREACVQRMRHSRNSCRSSNLKTRLKES